MTEIPWLGNRFSIKNQLLRMAQNVVPRATYNNVDDAPKHLELQIRISDFKFPNPLHGSTFEDVTEAAAGKLALWLQKQKGVSFIGTGVELQSRSLNEERPMRSSDGIA
ncbi:hypothetical protein G6514_000814 [Epicoccum nigrum]|nr:hypothetical protein G6514_000814 [Epicoccum nigrum]